MNILEQLREDLAQTIQLANAQSMLSDHMLDADECAKVIREYSLRTYRTPQRVIDALDNIYRHYEGREDNPNFNVLFKYLQQLKQPDAVAPKPALTPAVVYHAVLSAMYGNSHPHDDYYLVFIKADEVQTVAEQLARKLGAVDEPT